jgi:Tfp pilus assembly PilM family ATPase
MAHLLAIDWDRTEIRYLLVNRTGRSGAPRLVRAARVPRVESPAEASAAEIPESLQPDEPTLDENEILAQTIQSALADQKPAQTVLVGIDRQSIDMFYCQVPPASEDELPMLAENIAMRESSVASKGATLDFLSVSDDPTKPFELMVAILPEKEKTAIELICESARLKPKRFLLRPVSTAGLFARIAPPSENPALLINQIGNQIDLSLLIGKRIVFSRTAQLSDTTETDAIVRQMVVEINRTRALATKHSEKAGAIEAIYLFGSPIEHEALVNSITDELEIDVVLVDPFDSFQVDETKTVLPESTGRFTALAGMILEEIDSQKKQKKGEPEIPSIDFLNPRKTPTPPNRRRLYSIIGVALACLIGFGLFDTWEKVSVLEHDNRKLSVEYSKIKKQLTSAKKQKSTLGTINAWRAAEIIWLDELRDLALRLPNRENMVIKKLSLTPGRGGSGGAVGYSGLVSDPAVVVAMESELRDKYHTIRSKRVQENKSAKDDADQNNFPWQFESTLTIARRPRDQFISHLSPEELQERQASAEAAAAKSKAKKSKRSRTKGKK